VGPIHGPARSKRDSVLTFAAGSRRRAVVRSPKTAGAACPLNPLRRWAPELAPRGACPRPHRNRLAAGALRETFRMTTSADQPTVTRAGPRKKEAVTHLADVLRRASSAVVTDYRGLTVKQLEDLRRRLRAEGVEYVVVKNTLARRAASAAGVDAFADVLTGPVGLAVGYGDLSAPARILNDYFRQNRILPMVAALVDGQVLDQAGVRTLAQLPGREVLLAQLAGSLQSPLTGLAGALDSIPSTLAATLEAYGAKLAAA